MSTASTATTEDRNVQLVKQEIVDAESKTREIIKKLQEHEETVSTLTTQVERQSLQIAEKENELRQLKSNTNETAAETARMTEELSMYKKELDGILTKTRGLNTLLQQAVDVKPPPAAANQAAGGLIKARYRYGQAGSSYNRRNRGSKRRQTHKRKIRSLRRKY